MEMVCPVHRAVRVAFLAHEAAVAALPLHPVSDWSAGWAGRAAWSTRQAAGVVLLEHQAARLRQAGLPVRERCRPDALLIRGETIQSKNFFANKS